MNDLKVQRSDWRFLLFHAYMLPCILAAIFATALLTVIPSILTEIAPTLIGIFCLCYFLTAPNALIIARRRRYTPSIMVASSALVGLLLYGIGVCVVAVAPASLLIWLTLCAVYATVGSFITLVFASTAATEIESKLKDRELITVGCGGWKHPTLPPPEVAP